MQMPGQSHPPGPPGPGMNGSANGGGNAPAPPAPPGPPSDEPPPMPSPAEQAAVLAQFRAQMGRAEEDKKNVSDEVNAFTSNLTKGLMAHQQRVADGESVPL